MAFTVASGNSIHGSKYTGVSGLLFSVRAAHGGASVPWRAEGRSGEGLGCNSLDYHSRAVHMARSEIAGFALTIAKKNSRVESRYARFDPRNRSGSRRRYFLIYGLTSNSQ